MDMFLLWALKRSRKGSRFAPPLAGLSLYRSRVALVGAEASRKTRGARWTKVLAWDKVHHEFRQVDPVESNGQRRLAVDNGVSFLNYGVLLCIHIA